MKKIAVIIMIFSFVFGARVYAEDFIKEQSDTAGVWKMEDFYAENKDKIGFDFNLEKMIDGIYSGEFELSFSGVLNKAANFFLGRIKEHTAASALLLLAAVLCGFSGKLGVFGKAGGNAAFYVCFSAVCGICASVFAETAERGAETVRMMSDFVKITAPVLTTLCMAGGQAGYASALSPLLYGAAAVSIGAVNAFVVPLSYASFSINAVSSVGEGINLSRGVKLIRSFAKWIMTFLMTVFSGVSVICSAAGGAANALVGKTVKFAVGSFVPVVGGMLADSMDMVMTCTGVVKSAAGAGGMAAILLMFVSCAASLAAELVLLRCIAALSALLCDERVVNLLDGTADCISIILAALCMCSFFFLVIITIMISGAGI